MSENLDIHAWADGEVGEDERALFRQKLADDPRLQQELESVTLLKTALKSHCKSIHCEDTWGACRNRLDAIEKTERVNGFVGKFAWQFCGALTVFILIAGAWARIGNSSRSIDPSQVPNIAGFSSMQPSGESYGFQKYLRDTWTLNGAYRTQENGRDVVLYNLQDGIGPFALYAVAGVEKVEGPCHRKVQGMNCYNWVHNGVQFMVISDRDHTELEAIAAKVNSMQ